jgi:hypothetical protein
MGCSMDIREAPQLYHVVIWIHELQLENVDFEVDSKKVVDYFYRGSKEFEAIMGGLYPLL